MVSLSRSFRLGTLLVGCGLVLGASCARGPAKTLVSGGYSVRIGSDGSVLSIVSPNGAFKAAGRGGAGLVACGGRSFPLAAPLRSDARRKRDPFRL